jgi:hypothetical protein
MKSFTLLALLRSTSALARLYKFVGKRKVVCVLAEPSPFEVSESLVVCFLAWFLIKQS